jgi:hypothetical protein
VLAINKTIRSPPIGSRVVFWWWFSRKPEHLLVSHMMDNQEVLKERQP